MLGMDYEPVYTCHYLIQYTQIVNGNNQLEYCEQFDSFYNMWMMKFKF